MKKLLHVYFIGSKPLFILALILQTFFITAASCNPDGQKWTPPGEQPTQPKVPDNEKSDDDENNNEIETNKITIRVGNSSFSATLEDNATAKAFKKRLPLTIEMSEMNGNEKYYYLPESLPTSAISPGTIREGDLMLYGSDCLVVFYKTFQTSYRYTRIGKIDSPTELATALGKGNVTITFEIAASQSEPM
ncbi:cyclophilin-like fold protein [uncultured Sanguibacteroides sp.]|uniref:cyclophilin-like fold protein n=1 Tax=uncultured Sanguibacteroides sp. TaxID=1635151 RepID=UPI0025EAEBF7|nr:cyclophilin-like fold protein [uncultured Sanguibacteroides sp.]